MGSSRITGSSQWYQEVPCRVCIPYVLSVWSWQWLWAMAVGFFQCTIDFYPTSEHYNVKNLQERILRLHTVKLSLKQVPARGRWHLQRVKLPMQKLFFSNLTDTWDRRALCPLLTSHHFSKILITFFCTIDSFTLLTIIPQNEMGLRSALSCIKGWYFCHLAKGPFKSKLHLIEHFHVNYVANEMTEAKMSWGW